MHYRTTLLLYYSNNLSLININDHCIHLICQVRDMSAGDQPRQFKQKGE